MKTLTLGITLLLSFSCAKKNPAHEANPIKELVARNTQELLTMKEDLTKKAMMAVKDARVFPVLTKNLDMVFPNPDKAGKVMLIGEDAKAAYEALEVVPLDINDSEFYFAMNQKKGEALSCLEMISSDEEGPTTYGCELEINYESGSVSNIGGHLDASEEVPLKYEGFNLILSEEESSIILRENTALVLYTALNAPESYLDNESIKKAGDHYSCTKKKSRISDDVITCKFVFNPQTGEVM